MRALIAAIFVISCWSPGGAQAKPVPAEELSWSVDRQDIKLRWRTSGPSAAVRYYIDICRRERGSWRRILGTYVAQPPFTFERPAPQTEYAWRVLSVDLGNEQDFVASPWQILQTPVAPP